MTKEEWRNLKEGTIVTVDGYGNYFIVRSVGYEDMDESEFTSDEDYIIEVTDYVSTAFRGLVVRYYKCHIVEDPSIIEGLKLSEESDDYISFMEGFIEGLNFKKVN